MQKNCAGVLVFIRSAAIQGGVIKWAEGVTLAIKILSLAFSVVCLILLTTWHSHNNDNYAGNKKTVIPAAFTVRLVILTRNIEITNGLHQK